MDVPNNVANWIWSVISGLALVVLGLLSKRISDVEKQVSVVKTTYVHNNTHKLQEQIQVERLAHFEQRYEDMKTQNKREHEGINTTLIGMSKDIGDIKTCVTKLAIRRRGDRAENGLEE